MELSCKRIQSGQNRFEKYLYYAILLIAEVYLQLSIYRYIMNLTAYFLLISILKRALLVVVIAAAAELIVLRIRKPDQWQQKKQELLSWCSYEQLYLVFIFLWYVAACFVRQSVYGGDCFENNSYLLFVTFAIAFLLFPLARYCGREQAKQAVDWLLTTAVIPFAVFSVWLMWHYFRAEYVMLPSGSQLAMEAPAILHFNDLNHNVIAQNVLAVLGVSVYLSVTRKGIARVLYFVCTAIYTVFLILTNSRNSWFAAVIFLTASAFLFGWNRQGNRNRFVRTGVSIALAVIAGVFCHLLRNEVFELLKLSLSRFIIASTAAGTAAGTAIGTAAAESGAELARGYEDLGTVALRLPLYRASILAMFSNWVNFLFGVTPEDVVGTLREYEGVSQTYSYGHAHNYFLQMGVAHGVPAMLGSIAFAFSLFIRCIRIIFAYAKKLFCGSGVIALLIISLLAANILECCLSSNPTSANFLCTVFYLLAGWIVAIDDDIRSGASGVADVA